MSTAANGGDGNTPDATTSASSLEDLALAQAGIYMFLRGVTVGVDHCRFLAQASVGAVGVYFALYAFVLSDDFQPTGGFLGLPPALILLLPAALLLAATLFATAGLLPIETQLSVSALSDESKSSKETVEAVRNKAIEKRRKAGKNSLGFFIAGVIAAGIVIGGFAYDSRNNDEPDRFALILTQNGTLACGKLSTAQSQGTEGAISLKTTDSSVISGEVVQFELVDGCPGD